MNQRQAQSGAVLIISLIILLTLTVLGLSSMRTTTMEELMTRNTRDYKIAFEGADSGTAFGRSLLQGFNTEPADCNVGSSCGAMNIYKLDSMLAEGAIGDQNSGWWSTNNSALFLASAANLLDPGSVTGTETPIGSAAPELVADATFIPDTLVRGHKYAKIPGRHIYKVSSRGTGLAGSTQVIVQQTVARRFN